MTLEEKTTNKSKLSKIKSHVIRHSQNFKKHIHKHHKKYISGSVLYAVSHILILKILALKLFVFKFFIAGLAFLGIYNHPMTDIFANMENLCINGKPMIAQQKCERNFNTIQEAVAYIESEVNPETDTIYNAAHYGLMTSILREYCGPKIDRTVLKRQTALYRSIGKVKVSTKKIEYIKKIYDIGYTKSKSTIGTGEKVFCSTKYEAYNMLDMSKKAFLKEMKKRGLLDPTTLSGATSSSSDLLLLSSFYGSDKEIKSDIPYTLPTYESKYNQALAKIIKNKTLQATDDAIALLEDNNILSKKDISLIKKNLSVVFNPGCDKNTGYHKINQYLNDKNEVIDTSLENIQLNVNLCKSYQYIDELSTNISKLLIHEIGHYVYYFKDKTSSDFESICRNDKLNKCESDDFVTKYSQTNAEEDYSETFSRRALAELKNDQRYISFYQKSEVPVEILNLALPKFTMVSSGSKLHGSATSPVDIMSQKFSYFNKLVSKK